MTIAAYQSMRQGSSWYTVRSWTGLEAGKVSEWSCMGKYSEINAGTAKKLTCLAGEAEAYQEQQ